MIFHMNCTCILTGYPLQYRYQLFHKCKSFVADLFSMLGQHVSHEIVDTSRPGCPPEYFNIKVPTGHSIYDKDKYGDRTVPFVRSSYDGSSGKSPNSPRQQVRVHDHGEFKDDFVYLMCNGLICDSLFIYEGSICKSYYFRKVYSNLFKRLVDRSMTPHLGQMAESYTAQRNHGLTV